MEEAFNKIIRVIDSCTNVKHLETTLVMIGLFRDMFENPQIANILNLRIKTKLFKLQQCK